MFSPSQAREFREVTEDCNFRLGSMGDEEARMLMGMLVGAVFEQNGAMTPELTDLVAKYKQLKPHLAPDIDAFVASRGMIGHP